MQVRPVIIEQVTQEQGGSWRVTVRTTGAAFETRDLGARTPMKARAPAALEQKAGETGCTLELELDSVPEGWPGSVHATIETCEGRATALHPGSSPKDPRLPMAMYLHCLQEGISRTFGLKYAGVYECPCGIFRWDVLHRE